MPLVTISMTTQGAPLLAAKIFFVFCLVGGASSQPRKKWARNAQGNLANHRLYDIAADEELDWRKKGAISPVKNVGVRCSSGSSIVAAIDAIESVYSFYQEKPLKILSAQQVLDCLPGACNHTNISQTFAYIMKTASGLETEEFYPFTGVPEKCKFDKKKVAFMLKDYSWLLGNDEETLREFLYLGPAAATIDASQDSFRAYQSGVYFEPQCNASARTHGVLIVGFGTDKEEGDYWILKKSWDELWGEAGYTRMARNRGDPCGLAIQLFFVYADDHENE